MIVDLPATTIGTLSKRLLTLRQDVGAMALGRVLTLIIVVDEARCEETLKVAQAATHMHPSRIITVIRSSPRGSPRIDGQIRVGFKTDVNVVPDIANLVAAYSAEMAELLALAPPE